MIKLEFVVPRLDVMTSQNIYAIVKAELQSEEDFSEISRREMLRKRICRAVDEWASACGRKRLYNSNFDLGDLSNRLSTKFAPGASRQSKVEWKDSDLEYHLMQQGIESLSINLTFDDCDWYYDTDLSSPTEDD